MKEQSLLGIYSMSHCLFLSHFQMDLFFSLVWNVSIVTTLQWSDITFNQHKTYALINLFFIKVLKIITSKLLGKIEKPMSILIVTKLKLMFWFPKKVHGLLESFSHCWGLSTHQPGFCKALIKTLCHYLNCTKINTRNIIKKRTECFFFYLL